MVLFEGLLWGLFILIIFINGIYYFYNVNIITHFNDIFSSTPEIVVEKTNPKPVKQLVLDKKKFIIFQAINLLIMMQKLFVKHLIVI